jgi:hypothetical protein
MPFKDPERAKQYQREYKRSRRAAEVVPVKKTTYNPEQIATAKGLLQILSDTIAEVFNTEADVFIRARCIGYLVGVGLRAVELAELESRIAIIEEDLNAYKNTRGGTQAI